MPFPVRPRRPAELSKHSSPTRSAPCAISRCARHLGGKGRAAHRRLMVSGGRAAVTCPTSRREFGKMGLLGMHLEGTAAPACRPDACGIASRRLEATGLRPAVLRLGPGVLLAMFAIHRRSAPRGQKQEWLPRMAAGECHRHQLRPGEARPRPDPASMTARARRDGDDWILERHAVMWVTNGSVAAVAVVWAHRPSDGVRGFVVPYRRGYSAHRPVKPQDAAALASVTKRAGAGRRPPPRPRPSSPGRACVPERR